MNVRQVIPWDAIPGVDDPAFEDPGFGFEPAGEGEFRADGATWDGVTGGSDDGRALDRAPARRLRVSMAERPRPRRVLAAGGTVA